jgi:hypothetical protein
MSKTDRPSFPPIHHRRPILIFTFRPVRELEKNGQCKPCHLKIPHREPFLVIYFELYLGYGEYTFVICTTALAPKERHFESRPRSDRFEPTRPFALVKLHARPLLLRKGIGRRRFARSMCWRLYGGGADESRRGPSSGAATFSHCVSD